MRKISLKCALIAILAIVGMTVMIKEKESLLYLSEQQLIHFVPLMIMDWYFVSALVFAIIALFTYGIKDKGPIKPSITDRTVLTFSATFLIANTAILFMYAENQYPSGLWSQTGFGLSAVTPVGILLEGILLCVIWRTWYGLKQTTGVAAE